MNIIIFCLINDILKREVQITENRLLLERVKNETGMYRTISENYDKRSTVIAGKHLDSIKIEI